jgi:hypothetical protein
MAMAAIRFILDGGTDARLSINVPAGKGLEVEFRSRGISANEPIALVCRIQAEPREKAVLVEADPEDRQGFASRSDRPLLARVHVIVRRALEAEGWAGIPIHLRRLERWIGYAAAPPVLLDLVRYPDRDPDLLVRLGTGRMLLAGQDRQEEATPLAHFVTMLPTGFAGTTVEEAIRSLRPEAVPEGAPRQGEFFFVPVDLEVPAELIGRGVPLDGRFFRVSRTDDLRHLASELARAGDRTYVRGTITDPAHGAVELAGWHRVFRGLGLRDTNTGGD